MDKAKSLMVVCLSFIFSLFCADLFFAGSFLQLFVIVMLGGFFVSRKVIFLVIIAFLFGLLRFYFAWSYSSDHIIFVNGAVLAEACIVEEVDVRDDVVKYTVRFEGFAGKVLLNAARYPVYEYGDCFELKAKLEDPIVFEDFDYASYLARYGIYKIAYSPEMRFLYHLSGDFFMRPIFYLKSRFEHKINSKYSEPYASLLAGLILGSRRGIAEDLMNEFNTTGLTHVVAISGYNITLLVVVVNGLFMGFARRLRVVFSVMFIAIFCILVGSSAAVVRASIMGGVSLMALYFGRIYFVELALFLAAFLMAIFNPRIILDDIGFQLSFLATAGLIYFGDKLMNLLQFLPQRFLIRESAAMTLSAQVLALPVILYNFGRLSLIAPLANVVVLPFIPYVMLFGFLGLFLPVADFVAYLILKVVLMFVAAFASIPLSSVSVEWFSWPFVYVYFFLVLLFLRRKMFDFVQK